MLGFNTSWYFKLSFFYLLMSQYKLSQFLKNYFPLCKIIQKSFIPMAGDEDQLVLFVDVDLWQQWIVEWSGGTTVQVVLVPDAHY